MLTPIIAFSATPLAIIATYWAAYALLMAFTLCWDWRYSLYWERRLQKIAEAKRAATPPSGASDVYLIQERRLILPPPRR